MAESIVRRAVAIGGGTGLPTVLRCLLDLGLDTTAVVTMADDGGSSGALRRELGMLPPGDVRNCLVAMAEDPDGIAAQLVQYRFPHGEGLAGHAIGNLLIAALADITGSFPEAIDRMAGYLNARGQVLPSTLEDVRLHGVDREGNEVMGQAKLATNPAPVATAFLEPASPPAYEPALDAIRNADLIVIGPGSLYTSLIPNFLVAGVADAVRESAAQRVYVCNVANMRGETHGLDAADHVEALLEHGLEGTLDLALIHRHDESQPVSEGDVEGVDAGSMVIRRIEQMGVPVLVGDFADPDAPLRHSRAALCRTFAEVLA